MSICKRRLLPATAILLSFLVLPLIGQDYDPLQDANRYSSFASALRSPANRQTMHNRFIIGFNWGQTPRDTNDFRALRIHVLHDGLEITTNPDSDHYNVIANWVPWGTGFIHALKGVSHNTVTPYGWSTSMQYDPVVANRGSAYSFTPRLGDTTGAVWGFKVRDIEIGKVMEEDSTLVDESNYGRMVFTDTTLKRVNLERGAAATTPRLVLANPSPDILQAQDNIDEIRPAYEAFFQHPLNVNTYNSHEIFVRDGELGWHQLFLPRYYRDTTGVHPDSIVNYGAPPYWMDNRMRGGDSTVLYMRGDSTEWWLAANLRRLENLSQVNTPANTVVMSLRVPMIVRYDTVHFDRLARRVYTGRGTTLDTVYARFDSTCVAGDTISHPHYGLMDKTLASYNDTVFYIRAGMLPPGDRTVGGILRPDITLSAHFWLPRFASNDRYKSTQPERLGGEGGGVLLPTPTLPVLLETDTLRGYPRVVVMPVVERVHMEVSYHGNVDIALDYLRFETRLARMVLRGYKDSLVIKRAFEWYGHLDNIAPNRGLWSYRHYLMDETNPVYWRVQRHLSRLLEDEGTTETGWDFRGQYRHQTRDRQHWISWIGMESQVAAPYLRYGHGGMMDTASRSMHIFAGYSGRRTTGLPETFDFEIGRSRYSDTSALSILNGSLWNLSDSLYDISMHDSRLRSVQAAIEYHMNTRIMDNRELLYGPLPVWFNSWTFSEWALWTNNLSDKTRYPRTAAWKFGRPHTGEELRVVNWLALALGAKGLMPYKGGSSYDSENGIGQYGYTVYPSDNGSSGRYFPPGQSTGSNGGDFLDSLDTVWKFMNTDSLAAFTDIPTNRFYIGTQSMYSELARVHGFADDNGSELMRLQLQAVYSKGYKLQVSARDSTVDLGRYIDTSTAGGNNRFNVRRVHTRTGALAGSSVEPFQDSTFFMMTLLKDTTKPLDDLFYVCMVNRRTDPTIYYPAAGGTPLGDGVKFFSTNEFDSLLAGGYLNAQYVYPQYAQAGSRQIDLPLKLGRLLTDSVFSLVRITDVGGTLDTVLTESIVPTDGTYVLRLRFKPGEGKLLRVRILHPGTIPEGLLSYTNQRKMVAVPYQHDTTRVRYHITYHRTEDNHSEVFYRYSKPTARNTDEANIVWEAEWPISRAVQLAYGEWKPMQNLNCAYPSIVVRPDSNGVDCFHVVYACEHPDEKRQEQYIVEYATLANADPSSPVPAYGLVIDSLHGRALQHWGTPVISAIAGGNLYAWADSLQHIVAAYRPFGATTPTSKQFLHWSPSCDSAQHPSLATYARYGIGERTAPLVWQEDERIYYASPYVDDNGVLQLHHFAVSYTPGLSNGGIFWLPPNADTTILALCDPVCTRSNRLPVVYRGVESNGTAPDILLGLDRVAWQGRSADGSSTHQIYSRWIDQAADTTRSIWPYLMIRRSGLNKLYSTRFSFQQPDLAQGLARGSRSWWDDSATINGSDSAFVLSCISWDYMGALPLTNTKVWHLPFSYAASRAGDIIYPISLMQNHVIAQNGLQPHLAARPAVDATTWWRNRRVFEFGETPDILSSAQYYYRSILPRSDYSVTKVLTFSKACTSIGIFEPWYKDSPLVMKPKTGGGFKSVDTLQSDPFIMAGAVEVSFYLTGSDTTLATVELVNTHNNSRTTIPLVPASNTTATLVAQTFTNGGGYLHRIEFIRKAPMAEYSLNLLAGQIPLANSSGSIIGYAKSAAADRQDAPVQVVNLAVAGGEQQREGLHAYVYPNPAQEHISISTYRIYNQNMPVSTATTADRPTDDRVLVRVLSMMGVEVARFQTRTGAALECPVGHLPKGVYFVRVEQAGQPQDYGTTSFVLQ